MSHLPARTRRLGHELRQDPHHGVLVLEGAAPAPSLLIFLFLAVPSWPGKEAMQLATSPWGCSPRTQPREVAGMHRH